MTQLPAETKPKKSTALVRQAEHDDIDAQISSFESDTYEVLRGTTPKRGATIVYSITAFFVAAFVFAAIAKIDRVVTGGGELVSVGGQLFVSPLTPGIVLDIRVKPGDIVRKGDILAVLDPTLPRADLAQVEEKLKSSQARQARLFAEKTGTAMRCDSVEQVMALECSLWRQRRAEFDSTVLSFDAQSGAASANIETALSDIRQYQKRLSIANEVKDIYSPLVKEGYVSRLQVAGSNDAREELDRQLQGRRSEADSLRKNLANAQAQRRKFIDGWRAEVEANLVLVEGEIAVGKQALEKARKQLELTELTAPEDGIVLRVGKISTGSVADGTRSSPGDNALITLAPLNKPLEAEIEVLAKDIGFIRTGDSVAIRLTAYSFVRHGALEGTIRTISEGSFTYSSDNRAVAPYFKVRVVLGEKKLRNVPADFRMIPGLTLEADIKVGRRTFLSYLVDGILKTANIAMREPE